MLKRSLYISSTSENSKIQRLCCALGAVSCSTKRLLKALRKSSPNHLKGENGSNQGQIMLSTKEVSYIGHKIMWP